MLQPECKDCPGQKNCEYLSDQNCSLCPFLLTCPAEKLAQGFQACDRTQEVWKNLVKTCLLKHKFMTITEESGKSKKFQCMRCGAFANCKKIYESEPIEADKFDMFAEIEIKTVAVLECSHCQLRDKIPDNTIEEMGYMGIETVFSLKED